MSAHAFAQPQADLELTKDDFRLVANVVYREAGIVVREHKEAMVRGRLMRRCRELGLASISEYCALLRTPALERELPGLLNALTTNHTAFYREAHHFEHLAATALPSLMPDGPDRAGRFRIWCAASSTGEEPYTIAATVHAFVKGATPRDLRMLATDIDTDVLDRAERGVYPAQSVEVLAPALKAALLLEPTATPGQVQVSEKLRRMVAFKRLNIIENWPMSGPFEIIFCRNMLIYFDQPTKAGIIKRFISLLRPGGFLYLGHSEALPQAFPELVPCGRTIYQRR